MHLHYHRKYLIHFLLVLLAILGVIFYSFYDFMGNHSIALNEAQEEQYSQHHMDWLASFAPSTSEEHDQFVKPFRFSPVKNFSPPYAKQLPVLMYHHLLASKENKYPNNPVVLSVEKFEQQMKYLHENNYYTATLQELDQFLQHEIELPVKTVVITFDDGYKSTLHYAYPILKQFGFKASVFVITNKLTNAPEEFTPSRLVYLSASELDPMRDVFTIDSHTHDMHGLNKGKGLIQMLPPDQVLNDLSLSRMILNSDYLAYPIGRYDDHVISLVKKAGYRMAFTTDEGWVKPGDDPYSLQRVFVDSRFSLQQFKQLLMIH